MDRSDNEFSRDEITTFLRSRCIGFQRVGSELAAVVENLVRFGSGPPTLVYQIQQRTARTDRWVRSRPPIDVPVPKQR